MELNHPDDLSSFDYELHKNYAFILESDDVEGLELLCTLDVLNPWNERLTALTLFPEQRNEEFLNERNKVRYVETRTALKYVCRLSLIFTRSNSTF